MLTGCQRRIAFRVIRAYRTVSDEAVLFIARMPPADLLLRERTVVRARCAVLGREETVEAIKRSERSLLLERWQIKWSTATKAAWTRTTLPDLRRWMTSDFSECNYHVTQFLSGHGSFWQYLWKRKRATDWN